LIFTIAETQHFERQWLLTIYAKATTANMTAAELKELRRVYEKIAAAQR
jgi:division protein CdvB (Snf7/Vps24/ESCRT-III family)